MTEFITYWKNLFIRPKVFFENHFSEGKNDARYFYFAMFIFGTGTGIDRLDRQLTQHYLKGTLDQAGIINTWWGYWLIGIIAGIVGGCISYFVGGWFYNVRLKWCKADDDPETSKSLYLYSSFVLASVIVLIALINTFLFEKPYMEDSVFTIWDACSLLITVFTIYYSIYVSFVGVTTSTNANWTRAVIWFMVLPALIYSLLYFTVIGIIYAYFTR